MDDEEETYRLWKIRKTIMQARLQAVYAIFKKLVIVN